MSLLRTVRRCRKACAKHRTAAKNVRKKGAIAVAFLVGGDACGGGGGGGGGGGDGGGAPAPTPFRGRYAQCARSTARQFRSARQ